MNLVRTVVGLALLAMLPACGGSRTAIIIPDFHDPSFGPGGFFRVQGLQNGATPAVAIQPDGRVVVAGTATLSTGLAFAVARFTADGVPDSTFNGGGALTLAIGTGDAFPAAVQVQPDGKIVIAGTSSLGFTVIRLNSDGTSDSTFGGGDGEAESPTGGPSDVLTSLAIQPDGKIVVAGTLIDDFAVLRFTADGVLDPTWDTNGLLLTPVGPGNDFAYAVAIQSDGKVVVAGIAHNGAANEVALVRYFPDGSLDPSFDGDGIAMTAGVGVAVSLAITPGGKLVAAGSFNGDVAVWQFNTNGSPDASFGAGGRVTTPVGAAADFANAVAVLPDGRIVAAGGMLVGPKQHLAVMRYLPAGTLDPAFGAGGIGTMTAGLDSLAANALVVRPGGDVVIAGTTNGTGGSAIALLKFDADGVLDPKFRTIGAVTTTFGGSSLQCRSILLQPDGKIVVGGGSSMGISDLDRNLWRYNSDGSLDETFGTGGRVNAVSGADNDYITAIALQTDGKIVAAGYTHAGVTFTAHVSRYDSAGVLDAGFGTGGVVTLTVGSYSTIEALILQPDGKILVAGTALQATYDFLLARLLPNGTVDPAFGIVTTSIGTDTDSATAIALQPDGRILVAGATIDIPPFQNLAVVRYTAGGLLDATFGTGGVLVHPLTAQSVGANGVFLRPNGSFAVSAHTVNAAFDVDGLILQFQSNGTLDTTFGSAGTARMALPAFSSTGPVVMLPDGSIVMGGRTQTEGPGLFRFGAGGSFDGSFGFGGRIAVSYAPGRTEYMDVLAVQPDGRILVGGTSNTSALSEFGIARFVP